MSSDKFILCLGLVFYFLASQKVAASNLEGNVISYVTVTEHVENGCRQLRFRAAYMDSLHVLGKPRFKIEKEKMFVLVPLHLFGKSSNVAPFVDCNIIVPDKVKIVYFGCKYPVEIWPKNSVNKAYSEQEKIVLNFVKQLYSSQNPGKSLEDCYYIVEPGGSPNEISITIATYDREPSTVYTINMSEMKVVRKIRRQVAD